MSDISLHTNNLYKQLKKDISNSTSIFIKSSFIMKSGVDIIYEDLNNAIKNGADIKILTGDYLYITQPEALERLLGLDLELRLWLSNGDSFHPKAYIFNHSHEGAMIVGSSNLSKTAITNGIEWNLRVSKNVSEQVFTEAINNFLNSFYSGNTIELNNETIKEYKKNYNKFHSKNSYLSKKWSEQEEIELTLPNLKLEDTILISEETDSYPKVIKPRKAQVEALSALDETLQEEYSSALIVMATGLGKTYLAAFFAQRFKKILFIAHKEEILLQARKSFENVLGKTGGIFNGRIKEKDHDLLFASIFTLSMKEHIEKFKQDEFDLIIVDEFHHAAARSYKKLIDYFKPKFLLGLTATPERTDGQDILALCDGNVAYEINFIEAIQRGWLSPFIYYGIKDDIDYSKIRWLGTKYDQQELLNEQLKNGRAEYIYTKWGELKQTRTLAFCSSIEQANFLSDFFNKKGVKSIALTSQTKHITRNEAIRRLEAREIEIIFTVDLFNEGVDIPSVDTLLFVRPTESLVVFTQQIGRGLRTFAGKDHCVIIDLIGNYKNADTKLKIFLREEIGAKDFVSKYILPENCEVQFETEVINLLEELHKKRSSRKERLYLDYLKIKQSIGKRPSYKEAHLYGTINSKEYKQAFGGYFSFLNEYEELNEHEKEVYENHYRWLIKLEKEIMTKSYKMVLLQYLLRKGKEHWYKPITPKEVAPYFHHFYMSKAYRRNIDFTDKTTKKLWNYDENKIVKLISKMPMTKFLDKENLIKFDGERFGINFEIDEQDNEILFEMTKQICEYKLHTYFEKKSNCRQSNEV